VPGPVPTSPANRDYQAGFTADNMLKDLKLAQQAAQASGASTPMGAEAAQLFNLFVNSGNGAKDFSGIIRMLDGK
jgi:3-hydroxyisobutyrate dehydrogenase